MFIKKPMYESVPTKPTTLRQVRVKCGLSQMEVAEAIGISQKTMSNIEKYLVSPSLEDSINLCKVYNLKMKEYLELLKINTTDLF